MMTTVFLGFVALSVVAPAQSASHVTLGPRPFWLVDDMINSSLKDELESCAENTTSYAASEFSISHRGAPLQIPEHTIESYKAAILEGAGIIECDVIFTKDLELVCRHDQCDLHTTTDVVLRSELNSKCTVPFIANGTTSPTCCTSDFTLAEIKTLCAKMDSYGGETAATPEEYVYGGTEAWRTDLYQYNCPKVPTHMEYIELVASKGARFTPELKTPVVEMPFNGTYTQADYAQQMIDEYVEMGIDPKDVWPQSFLDLDIFYWIENTTFGDQGVALDDKDNATTAEYMAWHQRLKENGVKIVAPPLWRLVEVGTSDNGTEVSNEFGIIPSNYTMSAKEQGLDIIAWTLERTPPGLDGYYWQSLAELNKTDGHKYALLYVLAFDIGVLGVFSDWPSTTTFFANCFDLKLISEETSPEPADSTSEASSKTTTTRLVSFVSLIAAWVLN